jgi:hypothetical protein
MGCDGVNGSERTPVGSPIILMSHLSRMVESMVESSMIYPTTYICTTAYLRVWVW